MKTVLSMPLLSISTSEHLLFGWSVENTMDSYIKSTNLCIPGTHFEFSLS